MRGLDFLPSQPMIRVCSSISPAMLPTALPMRDTSSSVSSDRALPRMSYARKTWAGKPSTVFAGTLSGWLLRAGGRLRSRSWSEPSSSRILPDWNMGLVKSEPPRGRISTFACGMSVVDPALLWRRVRRVARRSCLAMDTSPGRLSSSGDFISAAEMTLLTCDSSTRLNITTMNVTAPMAASRHSASTEKRCVGLRVSSFSRVRDGVNTTSQLVSGMLAFRE